MGISSLSTMVGLVFVTIGAVLLLLKKYKKTAIASLIVGGILMVLPVSLIYFLLD
jgi:uncharacterized membrane protein